MHEEAKDEDRRQEEMENGNGEGKGEFISQNNNGFFDSMSMLSSLPPPWGSSLPPSPHPPPHSLLHALTVPDKFHQPQAPNYHLTLHYKTPKYN